MLTTSPILASSATTSVHGRHPHLLAHAHAPLGSSTTAATAAGAAAPIPRRPSSRSITSSTSASMKSPVAPRSWRDDAQGHVLAVEATPDGTTTTDHQTTQSTPLDPPPSPRPHPMIKTASAIETPPTQTPTSLSAPDAQPQAALSPNKRRVSPEPSAGEDTSADDTNASKQPSPKATKRAKAEESPPKILPQLYEFCAPVDMVELISHMLSELITTNDAIQMSSGSLTRFHSRTAPGISVRDYLHRLARHATLTPPLLLAMVYYIDRLCLMYQDFTINTLTVHRFLITAATVAAKGLSDSFWNNATYARVGGVRVAELKLLELEFLHRVDWKIVPNPEVLVAYYRGLVERTPGYTLESDGSSENDFIDEDSDDREEGEEEESD